MYKLENNILPFHNNKPYTLRQTCYRQTLSAVTGACMMMRNKVLRRLVDLRKGCLMHSMMRTYPDVKPVQLVYKLKKKKSTPRMKMLPVHEFLAAIEL